MEDLNLILDIMDVTNIMNNEDLDEIFSDIKAN
jgi:hypothetical protein